MPHLHYPPTRKTNHIDDYHGTPVADPYRWLEDPDSPETRAWIDAQNKLTRAFLDAIPARARIHQRLTELWNYPKAQAPFKKGSRYFQFRNTGLQNQDVLYVREALDAAPRVLLDPNALSEDGTVAVNFYEVSADGRWLAYATSTSGSDWLRWRVRDVNTGDDLPDVLEWAKFSNAAWLHDSSGFFYCRYDAPAQGKTYTGANFYHKVYLHRLGASQSEDTLIYHRPDQKEWNFQPRVSDDGRYLILHVSQGTDERNRIFYKDLQEPTLFPPHVASRETHPRAGFIAETSEFSRQYGFVELLSELEAAYHFVGNSGAVFFFRTNQDAPRGRLIAIDTTFETVRLETFIAETKDVLEAVTMAYNVFVARYLRDARHQLKLFDLEGEFLQELELPTLGSLLTVNGRRADHEFFYTFHSFIHPPTIYRHDVIQGLTELANTTELAFDATPYTTRQVFVRSKDGARVPMFLIHRNDLQFDGNHPTLLYGYGGFNIPMLPLFMQSRLVWLEMGGVLAVANLRGGGEYGAEWHRAGSLHQKQNVFDDFIACAEHLIAEKITSRARLAIHGRSNGGLLVGATLNQRPDLFGAALPYVGVMDMLRFHQFTIGWAWVSDYGSADNPDDFPVLYAYSPLHNLKQGAAYPPTLITTADHDDRVVPAHSFKYAAALQAAQGGAAPILIRIDVKAGHGMGKPTTMLIDDAADMWAFLAATIGKDVMG